MSIEVGLRRCRTGFWGFALIFRRRNRRILNRCISFIDGVNNRPVFLPKAQRTVPRCSLLLSFRKTWEPDNLGWKLSRSGSLGLKMQCRKEWGRLGSWIWSGRGTFEFPMFRCRHPSFWRYLLDDIIRIFLSIIFSLKLFS